MNIIPDYNPDFHNTPIKWFNSKITKNIKLGKNESLIKNCNVGNYPVDSVVVKTSSENYVEINFMSKPINPQSTNWYDKMAQRKNLIVYKSSKRVADSTISSGYRYDSSPKFNKIEFKSSIDCAEHEEFSLEKAMPYVNYIIKQLENQGTQQFI